jgi:superfamily II DNA helicase RecQ
LPKRGEGRSPKRAKQALPPVAVEIFLEVVMQIAIFTIPLSDNGSAQKELNHFLASNKVLKTESNFYAAESGAAWCFCVSYLPSVHKSFNESTDIKKVDYKNILSESAFTKFSTLRSIRKQLATQDAVPAYAVFTDAELAEISKLEIINDASILKISGIAAKRMEKYGNQLLALFNIENRL